MRERNGRRYCATANAVGATVARAAAHAPAAALPVSSERRVVSAHVTRARLRVGQPGGAAGGVSIAHGTEANAAARVLHAPGARLDARSRMRALHAHGGRRGQHIAPPSLDDAPRTRAQRQLFGANNRQKESDVAGSTIILLLRSLSRSAAGLAGRRRARECAALHVAGRASERARAARRRRSSMSAQRSFVSLWEAPPALFEGARVAALHGGGYRAALPDGGDGGAAQQAQQPPARCAETRGTACVHVCERVR